MSSPSQTLPLIRNLKMKQPTLKNQNQTLGIIAISEANIVSNTDTAVHSRASHSGIISTDASGSISEASAQVMNLKMERAKKTPIYVIV